MVDDRLGADSLQLCQSPFTTLTLRPDPLSKASEGLAAGGRAGSRATLQ